jgi:putative OPT family oligopeptide transporter
MQPKEFTPRALLLGLLLGLVFAVGNAYLGLKVGMTVSASIPAAVMSMAILRVLTRTATVQENNIVQTMASAGEAMAGGVIFTIPALYFLGSPPSDWRVFVIGFLGGILGILLMVPLRHHLIVEEADTLCFPEGTACAKILRARESGGVKARITFLGILFGFLQKGAIGLAHLWKETIAFPIGKSALFTLDTSAALLGVGVILGPIYGLILAAGGMLGWWVLIPLLSGGDVPPTEVWTHQIRYIGTGAVALAGIISLVRLLPKLYKTLHGHFKQMFGDSIHSHGKLRTERDLPLLWVAGGTLAILLLLFLLLGFNLVAIGISLVTAGAFVALTSMTVGLVGSSSNPVSGMIIITLLATCLVFLSLGWTGTGEGLIAMTVGCVAGVAIAMAGDISQDLKTGHLVEATPIRQQVAMMIGVILPAATIGWVLRLLDTTYGFGSAALPAPQATLMAVIVKGVLREDLPLHLVMIGMVISLCIELIGVRSIAFALGLYLPLSTTLAIGLGSVVGWAVHKISKRPSTAEHGVLAASGLVAGDALTGVLIAGLAVVGWISPDAKPLLGSWMAAAGYIALALVFGWLTLKREKPTVV